ncbi:type II secretion system protein [Halarcobacter ebronensis]|uniref:Prepilin-type cleavage/methylation domain-containing protein n=1 Tax=Halarcobacter ebronensis TaxID=1462615 RepID=A0A4Q1AJE3_9BACT|nr:type II secretion system protein [Halarcobacter ebronensis]QKF81397.1 type II secretion/transformation system, G protein [Halarcobacter ebronensis]RXK01843.1 prepilin-type cleavage/methylation domain-containing protein [Halarcobacter ebronensis]
MKMAFSLLELIFAIVVIGIISSFALPKYLDTRNQAMASTIQRDVVTAISSIQTYYLINRKIDNIGDALTLNTQYWHTEKMKTIFDENSKDCVILEITDEKIQIIVNEEAGSVCEELVKRGITTQDIDLI